MPAWSARERFPRFRIAIQSPASGRRLIPAKRRAARPLGTTGGELATARQWWCIMPGTRHGLEPWRRAAFELIRLADEARDIHDSLVDLVDEDIRQQQRKSEREMEAWWKRVLDLKLALWDACGRVAAGFNVPIPARVFKLCSETRRIVLGAELLPEKWATPEYREALTELLDDGRPVNLPDGLYDRWREFANTYSDASCPTGTTQRPRPNAGKQPRSGHGRNGGNLGKAADVRPSDSTILTPAEQLVLRILHDLESGDLNNRLPHIILGPAAPPCTSFVWAVANAINPRCPTEAAIPALEKMGLICAVLTGTIQRGEWHLPNGRVVETIFDYESAPRERRGTDRRGIGVLLNGHVFSGDGQPNVYLTVDGERRGSPEIVVPGLANFYTCTAKGIQKARALPTLDALAKGECAQSAGSNPPAPVDPATKGDERPKSLAESTTVQHQYDLFICHASEDKQEVVVPLTDELTRRDVRVWVDYKELRLGDRLRQRIEEGLRCARFGVVVVSKSFFGKDWPQAELDGLVALEQAEGSKRILPIWHDVEHADVARRLPTLAGRFAKKWQDGVKEVVAEILRVVRN